MKVFLKGLLHWWKKLAQDVLKSVCLLFGYIKDDPLTTMLLLLAFVGVFGSRAFDDKMLSAILLALGSISLVLYKQREDLR